jgi:hypothetical protein
MNGELYLQPKLHQAARLKALGFRNREICEKLDMSESHLSVVSNSPLFISVVKGLMEEMDEATKIAQQTLIEAAPEAAEKLVDIMRSTQHEGLKRLVTLDVLKGSGAIKTESTSPHVTVNLTENKMNIILDTIKEIRTSGSNGAAISGVKKLE